MIKIHISKKGGRIFMKQFFSQYRKCLRFYSSFLQIFSILFLIISMTLGIFFVYVFRQENHNLQQAAEHSYLNILESTTSRHRKPKAAVVSTRTRILRTHRTFFLPITAILSLSKKFCLLFKLETLSPPMSNSCKT